jgi:hypothetical protein
MNEEAMTNWGLLGQKQTNKTNLIYHILAILKLGVKTA